MVYVLTNMHSLLCIWNYSGIYLINMNNYFKSLDKDSSPQKLISDELWNSWTKSLINTPYASRLVSDVANYLGLKWPYKSRLDKISDYLQYSIYDIVNLGSIDKDKTRTLILCVAHLAFKKEEQKELIAPYKNFTPEKVSKASFNNSKNNTPVFKSFEYFEPAPFSILRRTILDLLKINENDRNYIWASFERLTLSNLETLSNKWEKLGLIYYVYPDDPLDSILALTLGYIHTIWNNESDFKEIIHNILCLIKKLLKKDISLEISSFCSNEKIFPNSYCSLLNGLTISPTFVYPGLVYKLHGYGIFKWSDLFKISEWDIVQRYGFCAKAIDFLKHIWLLIPHAMNIVKLLEPKTIPGNQWGSFEELVKSWISLRTDNKRDVDILMHRLGCYSDDSETLGFISQKHKISREAVRQIEKKLVDKLGHN